MALVRLRHNDSPDDLRRQIIKQLGESTVQILKITSEIIELEFDEREEPWKHPGAVGQAVENLIEKNEWIRWEESPGL